MSRHPHDCIVKFKMSVKCDEVFMNTNILIDKCENYGEAFMNVIVTGSYKDWNASLECSGLSINI